MGDEQKQAEHDARVALTYAEDCVRREEKAPREARTIADIVEEHAMELLDQLDGSVPRALMAAREACVSAASDVAHPGRWRTTMLAVELCRRAAGLASPEAASAREAARAALRASRAAGSTSPSGTTSATPTASATPAPPGTSTTPAAPATSASPGTAADSPGG